MNNPALAPGETKGRFAAGFTSAGLELLVEVEDPVHVMKADNGKVWEFDSLQFALDTKGEGFDVDRIEFAAALGEDGKPGFMESLCAEPGRRSAGALHARRRARPERPLPD